MGDFPFASTPPAVAYQQGAAGHSQKLQGWFAALAGRQTQRANIALIGDSITGGQGATSFPATWAQLLPVQLRGRFPTPGLTTGGRGFLPPLIPPTNPTTFTPPYVTVTGATAAQMASGSLYGFGPNLVSWDLSIQSGVTLTYSLTGDNADIIWIGASGNGTFSWKVDAGTATNVSTNVTFTGNQSVTSVSLGAAGAHTLTITFVSGSHTYVTGVVEYNTDKAAGIQVHDLGFSGATSFLWTPASGATSQAAGMIPLAPGLIMIELGVNDTASGITPAAWAGNVSAVIGAARAALTPPVPPVLLLMTYNAQADGPTSLTLWQKFVSAAYQLAAADTAIDVLDLSNFRMPPTNAAVTWGLYAGDQIHPSNAGHQAIADALVSFLSPY